MLSYQPGAVRIKYDLQKSFAIPEINENDAAMVTTPVHPAADRDFLADQAFVDLSAVMGAHRVSGCCRSFGGEMVRPVRAPCKAPQAYWVLISAVFGASFVGHDPWQFAKVGLAPGWYDNTERNDHL